MPLSVDCPVCGTAGAVAFVWPEPTGRVGEPRIHLTRIDCTNGCSVPPDDPEALRRLELAD